MNKFKDNFKSQKKVRIDKLDALAKTDRGSPLETVIQETEIVERKPRDNKYIREHSKRKEKETRHSRYRDTSDDYLENIYNEENRRHRRRSRNRAYFNPVLGDNSVMKNPTRTFVYYRQPFDWYDMNRCDIMDEYEEVYETEPDIYSRIYSHFSPSYDRLDRYDSDYDRRSSSRRRREQSSETDSDQSKLRSIMKKEKKQEKNLFAFSENDGQNRPTNQTQRKNYDEVRDLSELSENLSELSVEETRLYASKRY